jgi:hypothetical protein
MPILASLGTANDRAFGFGDSAKAYTNAVFVYSTVNIDVLLVGGGGGGGITYSSRAGEYLAGGGGGGGQVLYTPAVTLEPTALLTPYAPIVGAGGAAAEIVNFASTNGSNGQSSTFAGLTAIGGGGGAGGSNTGLTGASGGGAGVSLDLFDPIPQGGVGLYGGNGGNGARRFDGNGNAGGGGGGAGGNGENAAVTISGDGGIGVIQNITGSAVYYGGGGGGGEAGVGGLGGGGNGSVTGYEDQTSYNGVVNTGGGGGGGGAGRFGDFLRRTWVGKGGSGVVIIRALTSDIAKFKVYGGTKTTTGSYTVWTFTKEYNSVIPDTDYTLPSVITTNAEIIYDASNPLSVRSTINASMTQAVFNSSFVQLPNGNWYYPLPEGTDIKVGDIVTLTSGFSAVIVAISYAGTTIRAEHQNLYASSWGNDVNVTITAQATTWYDISGNNRHASLGGTPTITGAGANQYFVFTDTNNAQVPSVFETPSTGGNVTFVYYFVATLTEIDSIISTVQWGVNKYSFNGEVYFSGRSGSGGDNSSGDYDPSGWRLFKVTVDASYTDKGFTFSDRKDILTEIGGQTGNWEGTRTVSVLGKPTFSSFTAQDGADIKFVSLYATANDPGLTNVYNALKGRFGL